MILLLFSLAIFENQYNLEYKDSALYKISSTKVLDSRGVKCSNTIWYVISSDTLGNGSKTKVLHSRPVTEDRWIAVDKFHHFSYSLGITGLSYHIYHCQLQRDKREARILAVSLSAVAGIAKELWDEVRGEGVSYKDLCADALGIIVGTLFFI